MLPDDFNGDTGQVVLHIREIPVDELGFEPIVLEVTW